MLREVALVGGSYLLGSAPFLYWLGRLKGADLRQEEDMHLAAWQKVSRAIAAAGVVGDFAKGVIPIVAGRLLLDPQAGLLWIVFAGLAAVAGQMWTVFTRFDGEKGNSTGLAMAATLTIPAVTGAFFIALVPIAIGVGFRTAPHLLDKGKSLSERTRFASPPSRSLPLGMGGGFAALPLVTWGLGAAPEIYLGLAALFALIMLRRLTAGLRPDWRQASSKASVLLNRLLYDRSFV